MSNTRSVTGSIQLNIQPINTSPGRIRSNWTFTTGSTIIATEDRTGQIVRHGDQPDVWLVRETNKHKQEHTLVNEHNEERKVGEDTFWPWGVWQKIAG